MKEIILRDVRFGFVHCVFINGNGWFLGGYGHRRV